MKNFATRLLWAITLFSVWRYCEKTTSRNPDGEQKAVVAAQGLPAQFLGNYEGHQKEYYMYDESGVERVVYGQKLLVPALDFLFSLKENQQVTLVQTNLDDQSKYVYDGRYEILDSLSETIKLRLSLKESSGSSPTYILEIRKTDKTGTCSSKIEPTFEIVKRS